MENKRKQIINKAREIFAAKPYHEASMDIIAAEAGVAKGTLYNYFKDKEDLYVAVITDMFSGIDPILEYAAGMSADLWGKLEYAFSEILNYVLKDSDLASILSTEFPAKLVSKSANKEKLRREKEFRVVSFSKVFVMHREEAGLNPNISDIQASFLVLNILEGIVRRHVEGWGCNPGDDLNTVMAFLKNGLGGNC